MKVFKRGVELLSNVQISIEQTKTQRASGNAERAVGTFGQVSKSFINIDDLLYVSVLKAAINLPSSYNLNWYLINISQLKVCLRSR